MNNQEQNTQNQAQPVSTPQEPSVTVQNVQPVQSAPSAAPNIAAPNVEAAGAPQGPVIAGPNLQAASLTNLSNVGDANTQVKEQMTAESANIAAVTTNTSTTDQIAAGIKDGSFVNAVNDPNALIGGKVGSTISNEDEIMAKKAKKNIIRLLVFVVIVIIAGVGGFIFYQKEYTTAGIRIDALVDGINAYISPIFNDCEKRIGTYDLKVDVTQNTDKYGVHSSGSYGYDMASYYQINGEVDSIVSKEELLGDDPINYYFYIGDSKLYVKFEDLYEKFIYTDFTELDDFMKNVNQNDIAFEVAHAQLVAAVKAAIKAGGTIQSIGKANINGESKQANIVTINLNKNTLANIENTFFTALANNTVFVENYSKASGDTKEDVVKILNKMAKSDINYDGNISVKLYSSIFGTDFLGLDVMTTVNNTNYVFTMVPVASGYRFILKSGETKNLDLTYTRVFTAGADNKTYVNNLEGDIYYNKNVYQVKSALELVINLPYQEDKPVLRESISLKYLSLENIDEMLVKAKEKYNVAGTKLYGYKTDIYNHLGIGPDNIGVTTTDNGEVQVATTE